MAFHPDGRTLASGDISGIVTFWDPRARKESKAIRAHDSALRSVAFSDDGKRMLTAGNDQTFRQFDLATGKLLETRYLGSLATVVRYSPDRRCIASAGVDRALRIWSADEGESLGTWLGHTSMIRTSPLTPMEGVSHRRYDAAVGNLQWLGPRVLRGHDNYVYPVVFSPDGRWIAGGWDNAIRLGTLSAPIRRCLRGSGSWIALAFSPGSQTLYRANDATLRPGRSRPGTSSARIEENLSSLDLPLAISLRVAPTYGMRSRSFSGTCRACTNDALPELQDARLGLRAEKRTRGRCAVRPFDNDVAGDRSTIEA